MQRQRQDSDYEASAFCSGPCSASLVEKKHCFPQPNELTTGCVQALSGSRKNSTSKEGWFVYIKAHTCASNKHAVEYLR